jgi:hypothetical protein
MNADGTRIDAELERLNAMTQVVIGCAFNVTGVLGNGAAEKA